MSGVDDERKAKDLLARYSGNPWFEFGVRSYKCFACLKGRCLGVLCWWVDYIRRLFRITTVLALAFLLICSSIFAPANNKGWTSVRRAYAIAGVDDIAGMAIAALLIAGGSYLVSQSGVNYAGIAEDFGSWASDSLKNTVWEHGSEWVNPTASGSGYTIDVSKVPDSVLQGVMDYGVSLTNGIQAGTLPALIKTDRCLGYYRTSDMSISDVPLSAGSVQPTIDISYRYGDIVDALATRPYVLAFVTKDHNADNRGDAFVFLASKPWKISNTFTSYDAATNKITTKFTVGFADGPVDEKFTQATASTYNFPTFKNYNNGEAGPSTYSFTWNQDAAMWYMTTAVYDVQPIAEGVPDAISSPVQAYQADPTDANAQDAIDAIRAANPAVTLPEEAPQVVNNYNDYVTVNNGSGEVVDPSTPSEFDLTGLADAIAQALGGGATIASVLAALRSILDGMVTSDALAGEFAGVEELLRQLINIEQRAEEWRQQQELNADLDEIIRLLTSIDENVDAILRDMANLDRSTGDLVNLQPVIDAINGLQMPGDPVATDLSSLEHQMLDMTDSDGVTLTVHGLLHWINYYLQDIDRFLHDWNPYEPIDYSTVLGNIYDEVSAFTNTFTQFWADFDNYLDSVLWDLEHLQLAPRTPHAPYPTPLPNPETGIVPWEDMLNLNALRDAITRMMQKFPFATINNFVLILTMLVRPAQAPQFDLPLPNPSDWSDPYMVHVDLSIWDVPAAVLRTGTMLWAIARVSRRTVALWTREEEGGEGA